MEGKWFWGGWMVGGSEGVGILGFWRGWYIGHVYAYPWRDPPGRVHLRIRRHHRPATRWSGRVCPLGRVDANRGVPMCPLGGGGFICPMAKWRGIDVVGSATHQPPNHLPFPPFPFPRTPFPFPLVYLWGAKA